MLPVQYRMDGAHRLLEWWEIFLGYIPDCLRVQFKMIGHQGVSHAAAWGTADPLRRLAQNLKVADDCIPARRRILGDSAKINAMKSGPWRAAISKRHGCLENSIADQRAQRAANQGLYAPSRQLLEAGRPGSPESTV